MRIRALFLLIELWAIFGIAAAFAPAPPPRRIVPPAVETAVTDEVEAAFADYSRISDYEKLPLSPALSAADFRFYRAHYAPPIEGVVIADDPTRTARLEKIGASVFRQHKVEERCAVVLLASRLPTVFTWKLSFISFTTRDLELFDDDELAALIAHEIGHLYFADDLSRARDAGDDRAARIAELQCDLIALETLRRLRIKPSVLADALDKLVAARDALNIKNLAAGSPSLADRRRLINRWEQKTKEAAPTRNVRAAAATPPSLTPSLPPGDGSLTIRARIYEGADDAQATPVSSVFYLFKRSFVEILRSRHFTPEDDDDDNDAPAASPGSADRTDRTETAYLEAYAALTASGDELFGVDEETTLLRWLLDDAVAANRVAVFRTGDDGRSRTKTLPSGDYYLFGAATFNGELFVWNVPAHIGNGDRTLEIDQYNAGAAIGDRRRFYPNSYGGAADQDE